MKTEMNDMSNKYHMDWAPIRHLATSPTGFLIAAGEFERKVYVWDLVNKKCVCNLETILDFGGKRLTISCDGRHLVAGSYEFQGVTCYSIENGTEVWQRPDLIKPQTIHFFRDDACVIVATEDRKCRIVDRETGHTLTEIRGVKNMIESVWEPIIFVSAKLIELRRLTYELITEIPRITFTELDVIFANHHIIISESAGPIRCCDTTTGREIWRYFEKGRHALHLGYAPSTKTLMAIDWAYEHGSSYRLIHFDISTGRREMIAEIEPGEVAFCLHGTRLLTANGIIFDTHTGMKLGQLWPFGT